MWHLSIIFIFFVSHSAYAVKLNIYKSVTEVRQEECGTGSYSYSFTNSEYSNVLDGTITWDGTEFVKEEIFNTVDNLKGASVVVRTPCDCKYGSIKAKIVDPRTMLLKNTATGGYFYADARSIEYSKEKPDNGGTIVTFDFGGENKDFNGTFSYLMRGITWFPNYDLFVQGSGTCNLRAFANIRNNQEKEYQIDATSLFSGDLQLASRNSNNPVYRTAAKGAAPDMAGAPSIELSGEEKGFYAYTLKDIYTLFPQSTIRLPFIEANAQCTFYYKAITSISRGQYKGVFQRYYDMIVDQFLPAGIVTVRDNGVLMGQSSLPDVPVNYTQTIVLGQDRDVQYTVSGTVISSTKDATMVTSETYQLNVTIFNYKNKDVSGKLDFNGYSQTILGKTTCSSVTLDGTTITVPFEIKSNKHHKCRITVTIKWG